MIVKKKTAQVSLILPILFSLSACVGLQGTSSKISNPYKMVEVKEKLYRSTANYNQLVDLYRKTLADPLFKQPNLQHLYLYKLSEAYFAKRDYVSTLLYVQKLLNVTEYKERAMRLELKSFVEMGKYHNALEVAKEYHAAFPPSANVYNSQGIAYAGLGKYEQAKASFNQARAYFLDDITSLNNLAMLALIKGEYKNAVRLLLPQYLNGEKTSPLLFNLVFALVKSGDEQYAYQIIKKENLNATPTALINGLKQTKRLSQVIKSYPTFSNIEIPTPVQKEKSITESKLTKTESKSIKMESKFTTKEANATEKNIREPKR